MIDAYAALEQGDSLKPFQYDPGELAPDQVEIEVDYCGICHSDASMLTNDWGITRYPFVPGHEVVGRIEKKGSQVKGLEIGDSVGLGWHAGYCNHCQSCLSGDHNLCSDAQATIVGHHGGFAKQVRAQAHSVFKLPKEMDPASAGPLFCGGITVFNPLVEFNLEPTAKVGVIGIGGLGHLALQFLNAWGCDVTAFSSSESKQAQALELGAHRCIDSRDRSALEAAAGQFDLILSTVNVTLNWDLYLNTLKAKGRLHFLGAALEPLNLSVFGLIMGQRSVSGSPVGSPATIRKMLDFATRHQIAPKVEFFPMEKANEAIDHLIKGNPRYRIVLHNESR